MKKIIRDHYLFIIICIALMFLLLPFYRNGRIISGGEGSYFLNFPLTFQNFGYSWVNYGTGTYQFSLNFAFIFHLILLQKIFNNERIINFIMIYSIYFLPFLACYLLCIKLKIEKKIAILLSVFYITNPFMSSFLKYINQSNMLAAYILPSFFLIIFTFFDNNKKLFLFFGLHSLFFAFTNANPPLMVIYQIAIPLFIIIISVLKNEAPRADARSIFPPSLKELPAHRSFSVGGKSAEARPSRAKADEKIEISIILKKYFLVVTSFILFNFWWIVNWIYIFNESEKGYTKQFAISWLRGSYKFIPGIWKAFTTTSLLDHPLDPSHDFFTKHYSYWYAPIILIIPICIIIYFFITNRKSKQTSFSILGIILLTIGFLSKGTVSLFGGIYEFMVMNLPTFKIFKSANEKWGILFIFFFTLFLILIFKEIQKEKSKSFLVTLFLVYVFYSIIPFISGNFIPDYKHKDSNIEGTRKFLDKKEYKELRSALNKELETYRVLSLPGSLNYQVALKQDEGKFYTGNDPILNNINKSFIAGYTGTTPERLDHLFYPISYPNYLNTPGLYNIKKIVLNKDTYPWFGFIEKENILEIENILDRKLIPQKNQIINVYDVGKYFLPRFYIPEKIIYSPTSSQFDIPEILDVILLNSNNIRNSFYLKPSKIKFDSNFKENPFVKENSTDVITVGNIQSTVDEAKLRAGIEGLNPGGVLFPYARWKPGTFIYPYIKVKEEKIKQDSSNNPQLMIEQHLFFASKRISEIVKWDRELNDNEFKNIMSRYDKEMENSINLLAQLAKEGTINTYPTLLKIEVSFEAQRKRLFDVLKGDYKFSNHPKFKIAKSVMESIDKALMVLVKNNFAKTKYHFTIIEDGEYEILVENKNSSINFEISEITTNKEKGFTASFSGQTKNTRWNSLGTKNFSIGGHFFYLNTETQNNLFNDEFKKGIKDTDIEEGTIELINVDESKVIHHELINLKPQSAYSFSFLYKTYNNAPLKVIIIEERNIPEIPWNYYIEDISTFKKKVLINKTLTSENKWSEFKTIINTNKYFKKIKFIIFPQSDFKNLGKVKVKRLELLEVFEPKVILRKTNSSKIKNIPKITFKKLNNTKYIVEVKNAKNPYFLIFSETFHRGWKAYINKNQKSKIKNQKYNNIVATYFDGEINEKKPEEIFLANNVLETLGKKYLPEKQHMIMNGYANSWYITPQDSDNKSDYRIIIEYWPQRLFYLSAIISVITLLISIVVNSKQIIKKT